MTLSKELPAPDKNVTSFNHRYAEIEDSKGNWLAMYRDEDVWVFSQTLCKKPDA